jgi:urea transport system permease protein
MDFLLQQVMTGLSIGSILLLIALGLAIIYGSMGVINMAHGEFVMLGAYGAWFMNAVFDVGLLGSLVIVFFAVGALGWLVERGVIRFLYRRTLDTILATWGIGVMLQQLIRLSAGGELRYVEMPSVLTGTVNVLGVEVPGYRVFIFLFVAGLFGTVASAFALGELTGSLAYWSNDTIAKALVLLAIIVLIRFRPQGLFAAKVRS